MSDVGDDVLVARFQQRHMFPQTGGREQTGVVVHYDGTDICRNVKVELVYWIDLPARY